MANCIARTIDGNYIITGVLVSAGNADMYLYEFDSNGDSIWAKKYSTPGTDAGYSIVQLPDSGIAVGGVTSYFSGMNDFWVFKIGGNVPSEIERECVPLPVTHNLVRAYPNPFNSSVSIDYVVPENAHIALDVLNIAGQRAATLVDEAKCAGKYTIRWEAGDMPSGLYFVRMIAGDAVSQKAILLIK